VVLPILRNEDICPRQRQDPDLSEDAYGSLTMTIRSTEKRVRYFIPVKLAHLDLAAAASPPSSSCAALPWTAETDGWIAGRVLG
jgi:hypothetical protein